MVRESLETERGCRQLAFVPFMVHGGCRALSGLALKQFAALIADDLMAFRCDIIDSDLQWAMAI